MKKWLCRVFILSITMMLCVACGGSIDPNTENSENENLEQGSDTEITNETELENETEVQIPWEEKTWEEVVTDDPGYKGAIELNKEFNSDATDLSKWFADYNGETLQRIASDNGRGVTQREDIIFYRTDEVDIQMIVKNMLGAMITPLMNPSDTRTYTIIRYELDAEQPIKQINENVWLLDIVSGYYEYEGVDFVDMQTLLGETIESKDGMVRFFAQGSDAAFQYIIVREGNVYRLQLAQNMGFGVEHY